MINWASYDSNAQISGLIILGIGLFFMLLRNPLGRFAEKYCRLLKISRLSYGASGWSLIYLVFGAIFCLIGILNFFNFIR